VFGILAHVFSPIGLRPLPHQFGPTSSPNRSFNKFVIGFPGHSFFLFSPFTKLGEIFFGLLSKLPIIWIFTLRFH